MGPYAIPKTSLWLVQIRGPRSLFTIKRRNNTYDITHFSYFRFDFSGRDVENTNRYWYLQGGPEKTAQTLMRYNFWTAGHRAYSSICQNLFQMINVLNLLTIYQLLKSAPNGIIHRIQIRWVWWPVRPDDFSSEDWRRWSSETSPERMLEYAQPRINQLCYWPVVKTTVVGDSFSWWTHWALFRLILWS